MVIVKISGGLGNQIYQYALYRKFLSLGIESKLSLSYFNDEMLMNLVPGHSKKFLLSDIFEGIKANFSTEEQDAKYAKFSSNSILRFLARKGFIKSLIIEDVQNEKSTYNPDILKRDNCFIDGYWQSAKYSSDIVEELRKELIFKKTLAGRNAEVARQMAECNSISIHVRRGDYVNTEYELLGMPYYSKAIALIEEKVENPRFFIFSDDIEWCKQNLGIEGMYINWNRGDNSYIDMQLMSLCKGNIVANSTFSIWAATLNKNNPIVIHPYKYSRFEIQKKDRWPEEGVEIVY